MSKYILYSELCGNTYVAMDFTRSCFANQLMSLKNKVFNKHAIKFMAFVFFKPQNYEAIEKTA